MSFSLRMGSPSGSIDVRVKPWPAPLITPNVSWSQDAAGRWLPCSRTIAGDFWDLRVTAFGPKSDMDALALWLDRNGRGSFTVEAVDGELFPPLVDQSSPLTACVVDVERMLRVFWASPVNGVDELVFTLRLLSPMFITATPSIASLRLQPEDERDSSWPIEPSFTQTGGALFQNRQDRTGRYRARFVQMTGEVASILAFLVHGPGRASAFPFPTFIGVEHPFGPARGGALKPCRVREWSLERLSLHMWAFEIEFVEDV